MQGGFFSPSGFAAMGPFLKAISCDSSFDALFTVQVVFQLEIESKADS